MTETTTAWQGTSSVSPWGERMPSGSAASARSTGFEWLQADRLRGRSSTTPERLVVIIQGGRAQAPWELSVDRLRTVVTSPSTGVSPEQAAARQLPTVSAMLASIRTAFSLNVTQLAQVLRVERPTVYSWVRDQASPRDENLRRMSTISRLAERWVAAAGCPMDPVHHHDPVTDAMSLLELLADEPLRTHVIGEHLERLGHGVEAPTSKKGRSGRRAAERLGIEFPSGRDPERVSFETGQRPVRE